MANIILPKAWQKIAPVPTDEGVWHKRRQVLKQLGLIGAGSMLLPSLLSSCRTENTERLPAKAETSPYQGPGPKEFNFPGMPDLYPAKRNERYTLDRPISPEHAATHHNNFYEFINPRGESIYDVYKEVGDWDTRDWSFEADGLVGKPGKYDLQDILKKIPLEERTYRFRCVERWSMAVPWTGFPLASLLKLLEPDNKARFVRFVSAANPDQMIGVRKQDWYPWPYYEGLRMDEAMNELAFIATGIYGKPLPRQNGAPMRLVVPWKYGYKNIKAIVRIELTDEQPGTFWNRLAPDEYPFMSNVNPEVPHPRWSQKTERMIPDGEPRATLPFNGYGEFVAGMY